MPDKGKGKERSWDDVPSNSREDTSPDEPRNDFLDEETQEENREGPSGSKTSDLASWATTGPSYNPPPPPRPGAQGADTPQKKKKGKVNDDLQHGPTTTTGQTIENLALRPKSQRAHPLPKANEEDLDSVLLQHAIMLSLENEQHGRDIHRSLESQGFHQFLQQARGDHPGKNTPEDQPSSPKSPKGSPPK